MFTLLCVHCIFLTFIINPHTSDWLIKLGLDFNLSKLEDLTVL